MGSMERRLFESGEQTPGGALQNPHVSGIRLSPALYGVERLQHLSTSAAGGRGLAAMADQVGTIFDSVTGFLASGMDNSRRDALKSISRVATRVGSKPADVLSHPSAFQDPLVSLRQERNADL